MNNGQLIGIMSLAVTSFGLGFGANEAISNAGQRERLSFEQAGVFRETVAAGITKKRFDDMKNQRDEAIDAMNRRIGELSVASGIINSGAAIDADGGWITGSFRSIVKNERYQTLTCAQRKEPDSIKKAAIRICGDRKVVETEIVYQVNPDICSATLHTVSCAQ